MTEKYNDYYVDKVVVITGAAGFIGSHLVDEVLAAGGRVVGLDNYLTGKAENLAAARTAGGERLEFIEVDLNNEAALLAALEQIVAKYGRIDNVYHFASPASPPLYQRYPTQTYLVNTIALHNILTFLRQRQPGARLLFAGTSETYGTPLEHPQKETYWGNVNPNGPRACYDESKRLGEAICGVFERDFDMDVRIVRIFNTYGPRMDLEDGRVLPQFIKQALAGVKLTIYGDGSQTRSYCYVSDLVRGILTFGAGASEQLRGQTINLGNPGEYTVLETAEIFNKLVGREGEDFEYFPLPKDDPTRRQPDITKAGELLGYAPEIDFPTGLARMWQSYQKESEG